MFEYYIKFSSEIEKENFINTLKTLDLKNKVFEVITKMHYKGDMLCENSFCNRSAGDIYAVCNTYFKISKVDLFQSIYTLCVNDCLLNSLYCPDIEKRVFYPEEFDGGSSRADEYDLVFTDYNKEHKIEKVNLTW